MVIDSADFYTLADQLDRFKVQAVKQLEVMHTYLTHSGGDVAMTSADDIYAVHKKPQSGEEADPLSLDFATILEGIAVSQSIPTNPEAYGFPAGTKFYKRRMDRSVQTIRTTRNQSAFSPRKLTTCPPERQHGLMES